MNAEQLKAAIAECEEKAEAFSEQRSAAEKEARRLRKRAEDYRKDLLQILTSGSEPAKTTGAKK